MNPERCNLCYRKCNVLRSEGAGFCRIAAKTRIARAELHCWEEPPISAGNGSGTVFFTGCNLRCCYCQNHEISDCGQIGREVDAHGLCEIMLKLQADGAANINLVTPTPHIATVIPAVEEAKQRGLTIPIVYNTGSYETVETLRSLEGVVDIYLPDFKYSSEVLARKYSQAPDYPRVALACIEEMYRQVGVLRTENGRGVKGVLVRHLVLPNNVPNAKGVLDLLRAHFPVSLPLSIMRQYTPVTSSYPELGRPVTGGEYSRVVDYARALGFEDIYIQDGASASGDFIPDWNLI